MMMAATLSLKGVMSTSPPELTMTTVFLFKEDAAAISSFCPAGNP